MSDDIANALMAASRGDNAVLQSLNQYFEQDLPQAIGRFVEIMANESVDGALRRQAAMFLKNAFAKRDADAQAAVTARYLELDGTLRQNIRLACEAVLGSNDAQARAGAAIITAQLACIEFSDNQWLDLIDKLTATVMAGADVDDGKRLTALETIGWICEDIVHFKPEALQPYADKILTAVVLHGMSANEANVRVRATAAHALYNLLEFAEGSFSADNERGVIMDAVFAATEAAHADVRVEAFGCLVAIAELYYEQLPAYIEKIFGRTAAALGNADEDEKVKVQAIEFWTTLAECETELDALNREAREQQQGELHEIFGIVEQVIEHLAPLLLRMLPKEEDIEEDDVEQMDFTVSMAAGTCLKLSAICIGDAIVDHVLPFVNDHIRNEHWRAREAAVMAFGSIVDGPLQKMLPMLPGVLPLLLEAMVNDPVLNVRDTAAWAVGQVCDVHPNSVTSMEILPKIMEAANAVLIKPDHPSPSASVCWLLDSIGVSVDEGDAHESCSLDPFFNTMMDTLLKTSQRPDGQQHNLRVSAIEALNTFIKVAPETALDSLLGLTSHFVGLLQRLLDAPMSGDAQSRQLMLDQMGEICSTLQAITNKLREALTREAADAMMTCYLKVLERGQTGNVVVEEALLAVSALINARDEAFAEYMQPFAPFLYAGLAKTDAPMVCRVSVGVVSDCCNALESAFVPYMNKTVELLMQALRVRDEKQLTLAVLGAFGDLAMACGADFYPHEPALMHILKVASEAKVNLSSPDAVEYYHNLLEAILDACVGIVQGYAAARSFEQLPDQAGEFTEFMLLFVVHVSTVHPPESTLRSAVGLLLDCVKIIGNMKPAVRTYVKRNADLMRILNDSMQKSDPHLRESAEMALQILAHS